ncbi:MAG: hypothetical protein RJA36_1045 [Pseudomonadota bacterium]|jgi:hypothetical protein
MATSTPDLIQDLLDFIALPDADDAAFSAMAMRLFAHQVRHNPAYARFCQSRGRTPATVRSWRDIPAVPVNGFKQLTLSCTPVESCQRVFTTSGTTGGEENKGRHYHPDLRVYDASMRRHFADCAGATPIRMAILFPDEAALPSSSLAHYLELCRQDFGLPGSRHYWTLEGMDEAGLLQFLRDARADRQPVALLGASYSFVHLMDALASLEEDCRLPAGSWLLDTGGFKGRSREIPMESFYAQLSQVFGVARERCLNMYGMTELSTQFYDRGNAVVPSLKRGPHWMRTRAIDPLSGASVPDGERGILVHTDLANYNSVLSILTEDVGIVGADGFQLLGRAEGAQAKGCSLAVESFVQAART